LGGPYRTGEPAEEPPVVKALAHVHGRAVVDMVFTAVLVRHVARVGAQIHAEPDARR
jgi:hypothetical protein